MLGIKLIILLSFLITLSFGEVHPGKILFDEAKCMECHNIEDFGGAGSKVKTYKEMRDRVDICLHSTDASWFDEDTQTVVDYLNETFYKFEKTE